MNKKITFRILKNLVKLGKKPTGLNWILLFLTVTGLAFGNEPPKRTTSEPWVDKGFGTELFEKRSRTSKHFLKSGNQATAYFSSNSIHYQDRTGQWQEISTEIEHNITAKNDFPYTAEKNSVRTYFPANPFTDYLMMNTKEGVFKEKVKAIVFLDKNLGTISTLSFSGSISSSVSNNKLTYVGFHPYLALVYTLGSDARKFDLQILSSAFLNSIPSSARYIRIIEEFVTPGNETLIKSSGNAISVISGDVEVFSFSQPVAFDNNHSQEDLLKGNIDFTQTGNSVKVLSTFSIEWLKVQNRQFPIHLDPVVNYYPQSVNFWTGYQTSSTGKTNGFLRLTTASTASWAKFDLTTLPGGASVTQSTYYGYHYQTTGAAKVAHIRGLGGTDPVPSAAAVIFAACYAGTSYNANYTFGASVYGWQAGLLNGAANADIASAAGTWIALGFGYNSGNTSFMYQYGWNAANPANKCYLEVDYTTTPCAGTPGANAVITPTGVICPNGSVNISLANSYSVGGITYAWQSSTVSSVGPWQSIPSLTAASVNTPSLNINTWFSVIITCTNSNGSVTATSGSVAVSPVILDSVYYFEGFEDIGTDNQLPNCSWASSHPGSTCLTYTSIQNQNRIPRTGNNFASFYYSPANNNSFWTNGIWMEAGLTYSASMWYQTEYYTYPTWQLNILLNTSQTAAGSSTIATSGGSGSAASPSYKSLSNTFTVPTSGYYYVGINAISNAACCGYYLSWDDLEISVPCQLNPVPLLVNANTSTICAGQAVNLTATGADTYLWNTGATTGPISVNPQVPTTYTVVGTNAISGCTAMATQYIEVNPSPIVSAVATDPAVCAGKTTYVQAYGAGTYLWSNNASGQSVSVTPVSTTVYTVIGTNNFGCSGSAVVTVSVNPLPVVSINSSAQNNLVCAEDETELTGTGAISYQWSSPTSLTYGNPALVSPNTTATYTLIGTDANGCQGSSTYQLNVAECVGLKDVSTTASGIKLYPNPSKGEFIIEIQDKLVHAIEVTDLSGRLVYSTSSNNEKISVDLSQFANGVYYVKVSSENQQEVIKVVKQ